MDRFKKIKKYSPLTETMFYILISLLKPLHGYGIMQKVEKLSRGRIKLGPGTLYGALGNLLEAKLIELRDRDQDPGDRRKVYSITDFGIELVTFEVDRLQEMLVDSKILLKERGKYNG